MKQQSVEQALAGYLGKSLQTHFGKGPLNIHVTLRPPFFTIYVMGFLTSSEALLMQQRESDSVAKTRELLMRDFLPNVQQELEREMEQSIEEFYYDWNLDTGTGMIWGKLERAPETDHSFPWPDHVNQKMFYRRINALSIRAQKEPTAINSFWMDDHTIMVERKGVFVEIERALLRTGFVEELMIAKRPLERQMVREAHLDTVLHRRVNDIFVDWHFGEEKGYLVLVLEK